MLVLDPACRDLPLATLPRTSPSCRRMLALFLVTVIAFRAALFFTHRMYILYRRLA